MEQVQKGITFSHLDKSGKEQSAHIQPSQEDIRQAEELSTVFTPAVLKARILMFARQHRGFVAAACVVPVMNPGGRLLYLWF